MNKLHLFAAAVLFNLVAFSQEVPVFNDFDKDQSGDISSDEFKATIYKTNKERAISSGLSKENAAAFARAQKATVLEIFASADSNSDQVLNRREFDSLLPSEETESTDTQAPSTTVTPPKRKAPAPDESVQDEPLKEFSFYDKDGDGEITKIELRIPYLTETRRLARKQGADAKETLKMQAATKKKYFFIFRKMDKNKDQVLTPDEF